RRRTPADRSWRRTRGASTASRTELSRPGLATVRRLDQRVAGWLAARCPANLGRDELQPRDALGRGDRTNGRPVLSTVRGGEKAVVGFWIDRPAVALVDEEHVVRPRRECCHRPPRIPAVARRIVRALLHPGERVGGPPADRGSALGTTQARNVRT